MCTERRTRDSLHVRCVHEERAERSKGIIEGETVNADGTTKRLTRMPKKTFCLFPSCVYDEFRLQLLTYFSCPEVTATRKLQPLKLANSGSNGSTTFGIQRDC